MKPSWTQAPDWANYLAMDARGVWAWFEFEPKQYSDLGGMWNEFTGRVQIFGWRDTLEGRP